MRYETKGKRNIDLGYNIPENKTLQITDNNGETPQFMLLGGRKIHLTSKPAEYIDVELVDMPTRVANNSILHSATAFDVGQEVNAIIEKQNAIKKAFAEILVFKNEIDNKLAEHELLIDGQLSELGQKQELNKQETDGSLIELSNGIKLNTGDIQNIYNLISELNQKAFDTDAELKDVVSVLNKHEHPKVTKESIGLGKADNTSDIEKPISKATQEALNTKASIDDLNELVEKITKLQKKQKDFQRGIDSLGGMGISTVNLEGGKKGQILRKKSNQNGDYYWADAQDIHSIEFSIVENLPENGKPYIVYLVPVDDPQTKDVYEEYVWVEKQSGTYDYEKLGTTEVDLTPYRKASDQDTIDAGKVDKVTTASRVYGTDASGNQTTYDKDSFGQVDDVKVNGTSVVSNKVASVTVPTQPSDIGAATAAQGTKADSAIQGVQINGTDLTIDANNKVNIPKAAQNVLGVVQQYASGSWGVILDSNGYLKLAPASETSIKNRSNVFMPITVSNLDIAIREGLGNNSLNWTEAYKTSARNTIDASQVSFVDWID